LSRRPRRERSASTAELAVARSLAEVYQTIADRGRWPRALAAIAKLLGVDGAALAESRGTEWRIVATSPGSERAAWRSGVRSSGGRTGVRAAAIELRSTRPLPAARLQLARAIVAHIENARALALQMRATTTTRQATQATLDRLGLGLLLVDAGRRVHRSNRTAREILERSASLRLEGDRLVSDDAELSAQLDRMLARLAGAPDGHVAEHLLLAGRGSQPVRVLGLRTHDGNADGLPCVLFLSDPDAGVETPDEVLARHYGLTRAESRVVARLLQGAPVDAVAAALGVRRETVRTHVKSIYRKIGTTRQIDLLSLVLRGPASLRWD